MKNFTSSTLKKALKDQGIYSGGSKTEANIAKDLIYCTDLAKFLEEGKFLGLFLADHMGIYDVYKGPSNSAPALESSAQFPIGDPLYI
jgi:hypothetical protein